MWLRAKFRALARVLLRGRPYRLRRCNKRQSAMRQYSTTQLDVFRDSQQEMLLAPPAAMACLWSRTSMLKEILDVVQEVGAWSGMQIVFECSCLMLQPGLSVVTFCHGR